MSIPSEYVLELELVERRGLVLEQEQEVIVEQELVLEQEQEVVVEQELGLVHVRQALVLEHSLGHSPGPA